MNKLVFLLLFLPLFGQAQLADTLEIDGKIHSVVFDQADSSDYFVVELGNVEGSFIHYFKNKNFIQKFEFSDKIYNLYVKGSVMYVSLLESERLLLFDRYADEVIKEKQGLYAVHHVDTSYIFATFQSERFGNSDDYYEKTGLQVLDVNTFDLVVKFRATNVLAVSQDRIVIDRKTNWNSVSERSNVHVLNTTTLNYGDRIYSQAGLISSGLIDISPDGQTVAIASQENIKLYNTDTGKLEKLIEQETYGDVRIKFKDKCTLNVTGSIKNQKFFGTINITTEVFCQKKYVDNVIKSRYFGVTNLIKTIIYNHDSKIIFHI